jgi:tetratricopeptide (TPR) repeat protein
VLRVHAALGEIDWRYGSGEARVAAIERLREVLAGTSGRSDLAEERAALLYQVGAALIEEGRREDAQVQLEAGLDIPCGAYWHMRMRNALATIHFYHGDFPGSLALLNAAWDDAEANGIDNFKARILSNRAGLYYGIGKFREAVEQHRLSAMWGRRTGSTFEYLAACLGESINLCLLAKYEGAIERAREAREVAAALPNTHEVAKSLEIEGLALHCIGSDDAALQLIRDAEVALEGRGFDDVWPRLHWLEARILGRRGEHGRAEALLKRAEGILRETRDWEDLPGVEIELHRLGWRRGATDVSAVQVREATVKAMEDGAVVVALRGCLVLMEILADHGVDDPDLESLVLRGLALAEQCGTREFVWRLSSGLGRLGIRRADREVSQQRLSHSLRVLREVSAELAGAHRQLYLSTPHARALLSALEQGQSR